MKFTQSTTSQPSDKNSPKDIHHYMDALRSGLLSKGKPFDDVYIEREDAYVLKNMLTECGYSQDRIDRLMAKLLENSPMGEIPLSQFFTQVKEMGAPEKKETNPVTLDVSMVPYLQSILQDFDLSPEEIGKVLNNGRTAEGGISLHQFIKELEIVAKQAMQASRGTVALDKSPQMIKSLESLGFKISEATQSGRFSLDDFIHTLKQMAEAVLQTKNDTGETSVIRLNVDDIKELNVRLSQTQHPQRMISQDNTTATGKVSAALENDKVTSPKVPEAIDRVLEKVMTSDTTDESLTAIIKNSKIKFDDPESKKIDAARPHENNKSVDAFGNTQTELAPKGEGKQIAGMPASGNMDSIRDLSGASGIHNPLDAQAAHSKPTGKVLDIPAEDIVHQREAETIQTFTHKSQNTGRALPNYLVDQLGKQISRSIVRGDGVVRFQLKPSELGFVKLEMHMTDSHLNISVAAENGAAKELLLSNIQELRDVLLGQGIKLDKIDVHIGGEFNQTFSNLHGGAEKDQGSHQGGGKTSFLSNDDNPEGFFESRNLSGQDSILDLVA